MSSSYNLNTLDVPILRNQRNGKIVNITSVGGRIAFPFDSIYHGTKFALEGLSESIQYELEPFGIKIILLEPWVVNSNFLKNLKTAVKVNSPYIRSSSWRYYVSKLS